MREEKIRAFLITSFFGFALLSLGGLLFSSCRQAPSYGNERATGFSTLVYYDADFFSKAEAFAGEDIPGKNDWLPLEEEQTQFLLDALCTGSGLSRDSSSYRLLDVSACDLNDSSTDGLAASPSAPRAYIRFYDEGYLDGYFTICIYPAEYWTSAPAPSPLSEPFLTFQEIQRRPDRYGGGKYIGNTYIAFQQEIADEIYRTICSWRSAPAK